MDHGGRLGLGLQRRPAFTQMHFQAHHQLFPQGVNRRVGDLGEALFEVVVQQVGFIRQHRQRDVVSHAISGLLTQSRHVFDHEIEVFGGEAHGGLQPQQIQLTDLTVLGPGLGFHTAAMVLQPVAVWETSSRVLLHGPVVEQLAVLQIHSNHLAGAETALLNHGFAAEIHHTGFRSHDHETVGGGAPARGAQPVAI